MVYYIYLDNAAISRFNIKNVLDIHDWTQKEI